MPYKSNVHTNTAVSDKVGNTYIAYWYQGINALASNPKIIKFNSGSTVIVGTNDGMNLGTNDEIILATNGENIFMVGAKKTGNPILGKRNNDLSITTSYRSIGTNALK